MALDNSNANGMVMPVSPMYANAGNGGFGNAFGGDGFWIILLFLLLGNNGWGNWGFGGMGGSIAADSAAMYPWMNQSNQISDGFRDQMMNSTINGIQSSITSGFGDVQNALCSGFGGVNMNLANGFAGVNASIANGFAQAEISNNARQIADMQQAFAAQTAMSQGFNALQAQQAQCCCDNRAGLADLRYTVATEACADRSAVNDALRDVLTANNASTQRILDQMCHDKIDAKNEKIAELQNQLSMAQLAASQNAQTAAILTDNLAQTNALEQYLAPVPRPAYIVQNPACACNNYGCGCGVA